jgi:hypothetical protein
METRALVHRVSVWGHAECSQWSWIADFPSQAGLLAHHWGQIQLFELLRREGDRGRYRGEMMALGLTVTDLGSHFCCFWAQCFGISKERRSVRGRQEDLQDLALRKRAVALKCRAAQGRNSGVVKCGRRKSTLAASIHPLLVNHKGASLPQLRIRII